MNPDSPKLQHQQKTEAAEVRHTEAQAVGREFSSVEEMLRQDAAQTNVPASIKSRLGESLRNEAAPGTGRPWWRRLFGNRNPESG